ncbi:MAG: hypothetical protein HY905_03855 [Deltaproteobacteria bacterium]|nr:hypothetical protein [Deltaproteobacteria bacterium]
MGFTIWFFIRHAEADIRPVALQAMEDFFHGRRAFPEASTRGYLEFAEVQVGLSGRRATQVYRVGYFKYKVDSRGMVDPDEQHRRMRLASEMAAGRLPPPFGSPDILDARDKFAARAYDHMGRWRPAEGDVAALRDAVNRRARRELL